jgi:hypothetical protein
MRTKALVRFNPPGSTNELRCQHEPGWLWLLSAQNEGKVNRAQSCAGICALEYPRFTPKREMLKAVKTGALIPDSLIAASRGITA